MRYWGAFAVVYVGGIIYANLLDVSRWWSLTGAAIFGVAIGVGFDLIHMDTQSRAAAFLQGKRSKP